MRRLLLLIIAWAIPAAAQDAHYWDNQYGTKGELLGGLVVGAPSDLSASFYNPGWLALRSDPSLLLTTQAFEYSTLTLDNPFSTTDGRNGMLRSAPGFLAGHFGKRRPGGWKVTWSYLEKMRFRYDDAVRLVQPYTGGEAVVSEAYRQVETNDSWYGATFSRAIGDHTAVGVTTYLAYRSQRRREHLSGQGVNETGGAATLQVVDDCRTWHARALAKIGLACDYRPVSFGLTVTTPSVGLAGGGESYQSFAATGLDVDGDGAVDDFLAAADQEGLDAAWRTPLSVAAGASWRSGRSGLYATAEWFHGVAAYSVIEAAPFQALTAGTMLAPSYRVQMASVVNFGVGFDHRFSDEFALYAAFRSDRAAQGRDDLSGILMTSWDLWHASGGASYRFMGLELTTGLEYSFGSDTARPATLPADGELGEDVSALDAVEVSYRRLKLLLGIDLAMLLGDS